MSELQSVTKSELEEFLDYLFDKSTGFIYSPTKDRNKPDKEAWTRHFFEWPNQRYELINHIRGNTTTVEVYIAPAIFSQPSALQGYVKSSRVYWVEFDGVLPTNDLLGTLPEPTLRILSSEEGHEHWYWRLDNEILDIQSLENTNRGLAYKLGADSSGWDCNQVLRPPETINHKRSKPVSILYRNESTVSSFLFDSIPKVPQLVRYSDLHEIPDAFDTVAKFKWPQNAWRLFREVKQPIGYRSTALMQLGYYCAEMGMSDAECYSIIRNADDRWGKFKGREDREHRLAEIVNIARIKHPIETTQNPFQILPVYGLQSLLDTEIEIEWLIPGCLQKQGSMMITGPSGVGKTQLSLRFAMNLALGHSFLDFQITEPSKILFFSLEMGHPDLKFFLSQMSRQYNEEEIKLLQKNLLLVPVGESVPLDTDAGQKTVEALIEEHRPLGFFWDSLGSATDEELGEKKAKQLASWSEKVRNKYEVFSWYVHHHRKAHAQNKKPKTQSDVYGSQYIVARQTTIYCLWQDNPDGPIEMINLKKRLAKLDRPFHIIRTDNLDFYRKVTSAFVTPRLQQTDETMNFIEETFSQVKDTPVGGFEI